MPLSFPVGRPVEIAVEAECTGRWHAVLDERWDVLLRQDGRAWLPPSIPELLGLGPETEVRVARQSLTVHGTRVAEVGMLRVRGGGLAAQPFSARPVAMDRVAEYAAVLHCGTRPIGYVRYLLLVRPQWLRGVLRLDHALEPVTRGPA